MFRVAALYVRRASCYFDLAVDCWDEARDARLYSGPLPVVAHPPCGVWGRLRHRAKPNEQDRSCGPAAVAAVRRFGGVLEQPHASSLWSHCGLPLPGHAFDDYGGHSLLVMQSWFGHAAPKPTWLYCCGVPRLSVSDLPPASLLLRPGGETAKLSKAQREHTPPAFASWLCAIAERARPGVTS